MTDNTNNIILITDELDYSSIPALLEEKDILSKMEEGTNSTSTNKSNEKIKPSDQLENYINLNVENKYEYDSEDENLLHLMDNIRIKDMPPFKKLEFSI